jgi:metal-responsive CopG/Arc/MetJ family transcriptional regulator
MNMLDTANMARAVQISLDEELLRRIDADPETKHRGRSAVVTSALLLYLRDKRRRAVDQSILKAYGDAAGDMVEEVEPLIGAQAWPKK